MVLLFEQKRQERVSQPHGHVERNNGRDCSSNALYLCASETGYMRTSAGI